MMCLLVDSFSVWWAMGDDRSVEALAESCGLPLERLRRHAEDEEWSRRRRAFDRVLEGHSGEGMNTRHRLLVEYIKGKAAAALMRFGVPPGHRLERIVAGSRLLLLVQKPQKNRNRRKE